MPIHRQFKTKFSALRLNRLDCVVYSDTFASSVTSTRGNNKRQGFVCDDALYVYHFPMKSEKGAANGLQKFTMDVGSPRQLHMDNAKVETEVAWRKIANDVWARVQQPSLTHRSKTNANTSLAQPAFTPA
jgi:hypothetical protein